MEAIFERTINLIGNENVEKLKNSKVIIFGLGGVGSFVLEALVRAGVSSFVLVDSDRICASNLNRQILATNETIGEYKTQAAQNRIKSINPLANVKSYNVFVDENTINDIDFTGANFVVDAIDTMSAKLQIIKKAQSLNIDIISSMGTGNKMNANCFRFSDIYKTKVCPMCKAVRKLCKENGIKELKVLYSQENPIKPKATCKKIAKEHEKCANKKNPPASISFVPSVAGLLIGGEVIKTIINYWGEGVDNS